MSPKSRKIDKHLPPRVYLKHKAYYYVDKKNKWHWLGKSLSTAMSAWTKKIDFDGTKIYNMNQLFDRYMIEIAPNKSPKSYKSNVIQVTFLRRTFGTMAPHQITAVDIYKYLDIRKIKAPVGANREKALLSHVFSLAIRWGIVVDNPCRHVKRLPESPRKRYIEDDEYIAVKSVASEVVKNLMDFAYLTGQRIGDILKIRLSDMSDDGIKIEQNKTKIKIIIGWSNALRECVERIKRMPRSDLYSLTLFCNSRGEPMTYDGFSSLWSRAMAKAIEEKLISDTFTFHDIRAKSSSDAENRQQASDLLGHTDIRMTERVYNRKHRKVMPIK